VSGAFSAEVAAGSVQKTRQLKTSAATALERMKKRADFLRAQKGRRQGTRLLTLETCASPEPGQAAARLGFTASRKVGGAVARNRAKRRLRAAAAACMPLLARPGRDYVLIARTATLSCSFAELTRDLVKAVNAAHDALERAGKQAATGGIDEEKEARHG
jgi:ribonuclease P protein component